MRTYVHGDATGSFALAGYGLASVGSAGVVAAMAMAPVSAAPPPRTRRVRGVVLTSSAPMPPPWRAAGEAAGMADPKGLVSGLRRPASGRR